MSRKVTTKQQPTPKITCNCCEKEKANTQYYTTNGKVKVDGRYPICKVCIKSDIGELKDKQHAYSDIYINKVKDLLRELNRPFFYDSWVSSIEESFERNTDLLGMYLKNIQLNFRDKTWKHSDDESKKIEVTIEEYEDKPVRERAKQNNENINRNTYQVTDEMINKWGEGYTDEEYRSFERKYQLLKNNYQEKTAMHTEALLTYIRYRVKEELATAKGDVKDAKDWGALAQKAAQDAKINPSQLSKSDLSDGLDTFGQLTRSVEQVVDIIPILPKFKASPQDKVDFTLWCYINYIRDLKSMPLVSYDEIYKFYEERKQEYLNQENAELTEDEL